MFARFCQLQRTSALFQDSNYRCVRPRGRPGDPKMTRQDLDKAYQQEFEDITDYEQSVPGSYNLLFDAYMKAYRTHDLDELFFWIEDPSIDLSCEIFQYGGPLLNRVVMETPPWPEAKRIINAILKNAKGKNVIDRRNKHFNDSPMSCAIKTRNYDMAVYLMEKGAAVDYVNRITGDNLLHSAAADETSDSNALIKILLEKGVPLNAPNLKGETPLHACLQRNSKAEDWNLRIEKVDMQGFYNCKQGIHNFPADYMDTLSRFVVLVKEYGYNFETLNNQGLCATLYAISLGQWNIAQTILELVPDESIPSDFLHHTIAEIFKGLFNPLLLSYFDLVNDSPLYSDDEDSIQQNLKYCLELIIDSFVVMENGHRDGGTEEKQGNPVTPERVRSEVSAGDLQRLMQVLCLDDIDDLPTSLIVANVAEEVFSTTEEKKAFEAFFTKFDEKAEFTYFRSFHRIWIRFTSSVEAVNAKLANHHREIHGHKIGCYFLEALKTSSDSNLKPPKPDKQFLISPPASPPVGWEQEHEAAPIGLDFHLLSAIASLAPGESHQLHEATETQPGIVVHICEDEDAGGEDSAESGEEDGYGYRTKTKPKIIQTACPARSS
ncbi:unnamed protein product [Cyprideis torosa]|uniref:Uncharacterized protein n=1 Tax=Cyprideis torosa TaxID=163714 RepID=A0A7R8WGP1_9CRUS|nr:unnamed protein product [Cyprideis torosa]CAG0898408.1 unnamed protein product [Cyprideis torosa]